MGNQIPVPYSGCASGQVQAGDYVIIRGRPYSNCTQFSLNLCTGPALENDVALHFNPRFHEACVVRNTMHNGKWAQEERHGHIPFSKNVDFSVQISAQKNCFQVFVNNHKFCDFNYRMLKEVIRFVVIKGEVSIFSIEPFQKAMSMKKQSVHSVPPLSYPAPNPPPYYPMMGPIDNPVLPLTIPVNGGMGPGRIIFLAGRVLPNPSRFTINLMCGPSTDYDIALTFDVRLKWSDCVNVIVRNAKIAGQWGKEEREISYFPFMPGTAFDIMILADEQGFKVAVNNQHFTQFYHRIHPFTQAAHLNVSGRDSVRFSQIRFQ